MKGRRQLLGWAAGTAAIAALGAPPRKARAAAPPPKVIRIAGGASFREKKLRLGTYLYVLNEQGWLAKQLAARGIALEWFTTAHAATGPMINEAFANRTLHFAGYGDLPSAILNANGVETRLVLPHGVGTGDTFLVVPAASPARTIEDLKGQRLAVHRGRPWEMPLVRLLASKGLSYSDFRLFNINPSAGMAAIAAGHVDALFTMTDAYLLEDKKVGKIIWSTKDAPLEWKTRTELWAARFFVDEQPELTQLVVTAFVKAAHWASQDENRDAMIKVATMNGTPDSVAQRMYDDRRVAWKDRWSPLFNGVVYDHYRSTLAFALEKKMIPRSLSLDTWFDRRFVARALEELGLKDYWKGNAPA